MAGELGRCGLAFAPSQPEIVYALVEAKKSVILRSADGGRNWQVVNNAENIHNRPFYYSRIFVHPKNENILYMLATQLSVSEDGGKTFRQLTSFGQSHSDYHAMWISPDGERLIVGNDGGVVISLNRGRNWRFVTNLPLGQFYHVDYDERKVMARIVKQGPQVIAAHLHHLKEHGEKKLLQEALDYLKEEGLENPLSHEHRMESHGCPSARAVSIKREKDREIKATKGRVESRLANWPIQLRLISPFAPYLEKAEILLSADCVPFAYGNFHEDFVKDKVVIILCPKLDENIDSYIEKLSEIIKINRPQSITVAHMEVPCCFGIVHIAKEAIKKSGINVELKDIVVKINGEAAALS